MNTRRVGLWLVGAGGGVGCTATLGLAALRQGLTDTTSMVTALPLFASLDLDNPDQFVVGGHEIRKTSFLQTVNELHERSNIFDRNLIEGCKETLEAWQQNVRTGTILNAGAAIARMANRDEPRTAVNARSAIEMIQEDLQEFQQNHRLDQVVVVNVASTEPPFATDTVHESLDALRSALDSKQPPLPASSLYAFAALDLGLPYINFTPSLGASCPALQQLCLERQTVNVGQDGKTGETLLKTVLAPMFAARNFHVLSWVGHNIFGNRDGQVLDDPQNKASKVKTKDQVVNQIVGYKPQTHVSIEYIESLDDWKTAWDHIHFQGFLGVKMMMQFTWQGCDSILAGPLVLDLARLALLSERRHEVGLLRHLACFFKNPLGVEDHDFFKQFALLEHYAVDAGVVSRES